MVHATLFFTVLSAALALPPHPLDDAIGQKKLASSRIFTQVVDSNAFFDVAKKAVAEAKAGGGANVIGPSYSQRIRVSMGQQLEVNAGDAAAPGAGGGAQALPPHPLDDVIGNARDARDLVRRLRQSKTFYKIVDRAVGTSEELKPGTFGAHFGQTVRVKIAEELLSNQAGAPGVEQAQHTEPVAPQVSRTAPSSVSRQTPARVRLFPRLRRN